MPATTPLAAMRAARVHTDASVTAADPAVADAGNDQLLEAGITGDVAEPARSDTVRTLVAYPPALDATDATDTDAG